MPSQVNINFPAGILQPPFYDNKIDPAVNFGGIGVVIGHEMTHGFDDQGAKYDLHGNVKNWFTAGGSGAVQRADQVRRGRVSRLRGGAGAEPERAADAGREHGGQRRPADCVPGAGGDDGEGRRAAEPGYVDGKRDGYTPEQRYFLGFAQVWCQNATRAAARVLAKTDPHSSGEWRTKGTVQNFDEFGKAFGCKVGQPMMPASGGCRTW